jgi:hypothetical protein
MKWINQGQEFDDVYNMISQKKRFYLFGAGDYGNQFFANFHNEFEIVGYIDNSEEKQGTLINGLKCNSLEQTKLTNDEAIIVTMSQMARVKPVQQLFKKGLRKNVAFFIIEEFISIYFVYKHDKVYFSSISFLPSTRCNLNCRNCLNFNPFAKEFYMREWEALIADVDLFFSCVDFIMLFHVSGGEPMLYPRIADLIEYIEKKYGDKIGTLRTVTNGTIVPKDEILEKLSKCSVEITVDDYREALPNSKENFDKLILKLNSYGIRHYINTVDGWIDLAPERTDYSGYTDEQMIAHRDACTQSWQELRGGKLYNCNYAAYATVAGIAGNEDMEETYDLTSFSQEKKKELVEFRLGFTKKGYTNFCRKCRGFTPENSETVSPAIQSQKIEL